MENMSFEVVSTISEHYSDDGKEGKELVKDILFYLYYITTDKKLKNRIEDWFDEEEYCIDCGEKLVPYEYNEWHSEVHAYETMCELVCPNCDFGYKNN